MPTIWLNWLNCAFMVSSDQVRWPAGSGKSFKAVAPVSCASAARCFFQEAPVPLVNCLRVRQVVGEIHKLGGDADRAQRVRPVGHFARLQERRGVGGQHRGRIHVRAPVLRQRAMEVLGEIRDDGVIRLVSDLGGGHLPGRRR